MGNDAGLFAGGEYDQDDREADAVWDAIDERMDERRRERREARLKVEVEKFRASNPKITEQFQDLKRKLAEVSESEWEAIPDIGDYTVKAQKRMQSFVPVPDTLLARAAAEKVLSASIDARDAGDGGAQTDLTAVGEGRGTVLALKLERLSDSVSGQTVVDPRGYLTDLKSLRVSSDAEVSDVKKARLLLKSVVSTNPGHAPGWIAAARLEELAGAMTAARQLAHRGTEACPGSEDVWLEAARLQPPAAAKSVLARGVAALPLSTKLWLAAAELEEEVPRRARVLRKALEALPTSVRLWKALVELSDEEDARLLLARAVECCPQQKDLWLALARLESYDDARRVLNRAREALPTEPAVWISAAKLEEAHGNGAVCDRILERALRSLKAHGVLIDRDAWLRDAEACEKAEPPAPATAGAIVAAVCGEGVEEADRKRTWLADAEEAARRGAAHTARAIFALAIQSFPAKKSVWLAAAQLERSAGSRQSLDALLRRAVQYCPRAEVLWLLAAKEAWLAGDVAGAREILAGAFAANPGSEDIWLAAFKLEFESGERQRARLILGRAREAVSSARVWMKSAQVEREEGDTAAERTLLAEGLRRFPDAPKLWLMRGQLEERCGDAAAARREYGLALRACPQHAPLWQAAAALEERCGGLPRARALLEAGRLKIPACAELWLAAVRAERRGGFAAEADALLAKALQDCPSAGILWAEAIATAPRPARKARSVDALRRCDADPAVIACVAALFAADRKLDKARSWYNRAVTIAPLIGDNWARYVAFERQHGGGDDVVRRAVDASPRYGQLWTSVSKRVENAHDSTEVILGKVVALVKEGN